MLDGEGDADTAVRFLAAFGIPRERLILENKSRNTAENAEFSYQLANPQPGETWLLVTSAFHMPRSVGLFRKAGFPVIAWPVDYRTSGKEGIGLFRDNPADSLQNTTMAVREWLGLIAYWLSGKIDQLLPAPGIGRIDQHLPRRREELPPHQHGDQEQRRQREHLRAGEPAEIADREEHAAQPGVEMLARQDVHARRAPDRDLDLFGLRRRRRAAPALRRSGSSSS